MGSVNFVFYNITNETINQSLNLTMNALSKQLINLTDPNIVVTTWDDIKMLVFITGAICMIVGYLIAEVNHYLSKRREKENKEGRRGG